MASQRRSQRGHHAMPCISLAFLLYLPLLVTSAFLLPSTVVGARSSSWILHETSSSTVPNTPPEENVSSSKNEKYILGLLDNLGATLDKYIMTGSPATRTRAHNILKQVERESFQPTLIQRAHRMASRAGLEPLPPDQEEWMEIGKQDTQQRRQEMEQRRHDWGNSDADTRQREAEERRQWEQQQQQQGGTGETGKSVANRVQGRSALSQRATGNNKPDVFMPQVDSNLDPQSFANNKSDLEMALQNQNNEVDEEAVAAAASKTSELVASAGAGSAFEGQQLGIGGLDNVLAQVKRRIWVPLAAPPHLLKELGINPVRGLLLYGMPGCGKTLLARTIGKILSPARPITVVSGPEIMDKFVGSSEKNLREIFDNPPDIYDSFRIKDPDGGEAMSRAALHVIVMDEFDAMARTRGGRGGKGDQGDAGVARDSVVNQLLAKMDGVDPLVVPTLVIGLTNKRSLVEPALLRPGRFEVQIEVPPPKTVEQRVSILEVHTKSMFRAGRVLVTDAPAGTAAARCIENEGSGGMLTYEQLLDLLAVECDGMSGAQLAGVARAAASHALERAVCDFSGHLVNGDDDGASILDCLVTQADFELAVEDVLESSGDTDWEGSDSSDEKKTLADSESDNMDPSAEEDSNTT